MSDLMEIEPKEPDKTKVTEAEIIVEGTSEKPYYEIKYHEVGSNHFNIGFGSYFLEYVMQWKKERGSERPVAVRKAGEEDDDHEDQPDVIRFPNGAHGMANRRPLGQLTRAGREEIPNAAAEVRALAAELKHKLI